MTTHTHPATGLRFTRDGAAVTVSGPTFAHRDALRAAGFAWDKGAEVWRGDVHAAVRIDVPRGWAIADGLAIRTKSKVGGGRVATGWT